jgi:hypothetical protein
VPLRAALSPPLAALAALVALAAARHRLLSSPARLSNCVVVVGR